MRLGSFSAKLTSTGGLCWLVQSGLVGAVIVALNVFLSWSKKDLVAVDVNVVMPCGVVFSGLSVSEHFPVLFVVQAASVVFGAASSVLFVARIFTVVFVTGRSARLVASYSMVVCVV